jgi:predicted DNA-binding ribbon-helix-helix protein
VSLEDAFWNALADMAAARKQSLASVIASIDQRRPAGRNLSAAIRIAVLEWSQKTRP